MCRTFSFLAIVVFSVALPNSFAQEKSEKVLRVGMIGLDTSHVVAFTKLLNNPKNTGDLAGVRVVAGYPGGSMDIPDSRDRVEKFTETLKTQYGIEIVNSIDELLTKVDVVLLESVDGRPHLAQVIPVLKAGKLVFIDKPIAGSLADAIAIFELSKKYKVPVFSSSSLRYYSSFAGLSAKVGDIRGCEVYGPCSLEPHHPDLFWYGIHGVETLFTIMGTGCQSVTRSHTKDTDVITGTWKDGRLGTFRGLRSLKSGYGALLYGTKDITLVPGKGSYEPLVAEICKFFKTGRPPVSAEETLQIFAFMEAADESKRQGGASVSLDYVISKARGQTESKKLASAVTPTTHTQSQAPARPGQVDVEQTDSNGVRQRARFWWLRPFRQ